MMPMKNGIVAPFPDVSTTKRLSVMCSPPVDSFLSCKYSFLRCCSDRLGIYTEYIRAWPAWLQDTKVTFSKYKTLCSVEHG